MKLRSTEGHRAVRQNSLRAACLAQQQLVLKSAAECVFMHDVCGKQSALTCLEIADVHMVKPDERLRIFP